MYNYSISSLARTDLSNRHACCYGTSEDDQDDDYFNDYPDDAARNKEEHRKRTHHKRTSQTLMQHSSVAFQVSDMHLTLEFGCIG